MSLHLKKNCKGGPAKFFFQLCPEVIGLHFIGSNWDPKWFFPFEIFRWATKKPSAGRSATSRGRLTPKGMYLFGREMEPLISGKSMMVKYYDLARLMGQDSYVLCCNPSTTTRRRRTTTTTTTTTATTTTTTRTTTTTTRLMFQKTYTHRFGKIFWQPFTTIKPSGKPSPTRVGPLGFLTSIKGNGKLNIRVLDFVQLSTMEWTKPFGGSLIGSGINILDIPRKFKSTKRLYYPAGSCCSCGRVMTPFEENFRRELWYPRPLSLGWMVG